MIKLKTPIYKQYLGKNPYKGFIPFEGIYSFPHSMEFFYMPLNDVQLAKNNFNWDILENKLNEIIKRGHTAVVRVYLDYPDKKSGFPEFYFEKTKPIKYKEFGGGITVDWNDKFVINNLINFIKRFAKKYDGDKRIAFLQCGLLGHWGEWHTWPDVKLMANVNNQKMILKTFLKYFKKTQCMARYPEYSYLQKLKIGFHDDSFCFSTLANKNTNFLGQMERAGLCDRYNTCAIGGEVRPEEQLSLNSKGKSKEEFYECVNNSHCSWLLNQGAFAKDVNKKLVLKMSCSLGYDFYVSNIAQISDTKIKISIVNVGVAPLYHDFNLHIVYYKNNYEVGIKKLCNLKHLKLAKTYEFFAYCGNYNTIILQARDNIGQQIVFSNNNIDKNGDVIIAEMVQDEKR